jgi:hypothetical protein
MLNLFQHLVLSFMSEILNQVQDDRSVKFQICLVRNYLKHIRTGPKSQTFDLLGDSE